MRRESSVDWERDVYAQGAQLNYWPYSEVVSAVSRCTRGQDRTRMRALEIGCGAGNNLWFLAEAGFRVAGQDLSQSALVHAGKRLREEGHAADLRQGDFSRLDWDDDSFDLVLDRGALTQVTRAHLDVALAEIHRVLRPGGRFLSFYLFGLDHEDRRFGAEVAPGSHDHFRDGLFAGVGLTTFFDEATIRHHWRAFEIESIERLRTERIAPSSHLEERYSVHARKPVRE